MHPRTFIYVAATLALTVAGFGAGYWIRDLRSSTNAQMEDYALWNVLENVGYAAFIAKGDVPQVRDLIDVNLNQHLTQLRLYQGSVKDEQFEASKIRALNAAARLWDERPPFAGITNSQAAGANAPWFVEWREITAENMRLLEWAKSQCASNPSLKCATGPVGR